MHDLLQILWLASWTLAAGAVAGMGLLIGFRILRDREDARRRAAHALVVTAYLRLMAGEAEAAEALPGHEASVLAAALLEILGVVRGGDRDRLVQALTGLGLDRRLRAALRRGLGPERLTAAEALCAFPGPENETALSRAIDHGEPAVRIAAAKSLLLMGASLDLIAFLSTALGGRAPRAASLSEVFRLAAERQPRECAAALTDRQVAEPVRVMLAEALSASTDYAVLPVLAQTALHDAPAVRAASLKTLGRLMHPATEPVVARSLADEDAQVRGAAAEAAGDAGWAGLTPQVAERLRDPVWTVRFQAAEALTRLGAGGLQALREAARSGPGEAARAASLTLAERRL